MCGMGMRSERHAGRITLKLQRHGANGDTDKRHFHAALLCQSCPLPGELTRKCHLNVSRTSSTEGRGWCSSWCALDLKE